MTTNPASGQTGPLQPLQVVLCNTTYADPAVDEPKVTPDVVQAFIDSPSATVLPMREGAKPLVWTLDRLTVGALASLGSMRQGGQTTDRMRMHAFRACCRSACIEGQVPTVEVLPPDSKAEREGVFVGTIVDGMLTAPEALVDFVRDRYGYESVMQLGQHAIDFARLPAGARVGFRYWAG